MKDLVCDIKAKLVEIKKGAVTKLKNSSFKSVLISLGYLFQLSAYFSIPAVFYGLFVNEVKATLSVLLTTVLFFSIGFPMQSLGKLESLNVKQSSILVILFFVFSPLIKTIPYIYMGIFQGNFFNQLINSYFETTSAFSTTGLTLIQDIPSLPGTLLLNRGLSQWVGGIGVVFVLISFFHSKKGVFPLGKVIGIKRMKNLSSSYKLTFEMVLFIYIIYTVILMILLMIFGVNPFDAVQSTLSIYSTTGMTRANIFNFPLAAIVIVAVMMLFSSLSFQFHLALWKKKWKELFDRELKFYMILLVIFIMLFWMTSGFSIFRSIFHVFDFSPSVGLDLLDFSEINSVCKMVLVVMMFIGPTAFSIGGGIRAQRFYILLKMLFKLPEIMLTGKIPQIKIGEVEFSRKDIIVTLLIIFLFLGLSIFAAIILTGYDYTFIDGLVESVSAITTTGDSPKNLTPSYPLIPKLILIFLMIAGRIEIYPVLLVFSKVKEKTRKALKINS